MSLIAEGAAPRQLVLSGVVSAATALVVAAVLLNFLILDILTVQEFHNTMIQI